MNYGINMVNIEGKGRFIRERTNPYYLIVTYTILMTIVGGFIIFAIRSLFSSADETFAKIALIIIFSGGGYGFTKLLYFYFRTSYKFLLKEKSFEHENIFSKWNNVEYESIFSITDYNNTGRTAVVKYRDAQNTVIKVYIHVVTSNFLELIETIIERSENLEELNIPKALEFAESIKSDEGRAPNWDIINRAERRAKENREKKQKEST